MRTDMHAGTPGWIKLLFSFAGVVLIGLAAMHALARRATDQWEACAAALRATGQPLTFAEIEAQRQVIPDDQNAARVVEGMMDELKQLGDSAREPAVLVFGSRTGGDGFFHGIARDRIEPSRRFLDEHRSLLERAEALRDKSAGRFHIVYDENPIHTLLPHLSGLRTLSKLFRLDAAIALIDGVPGRAVADVELQCRLAGTIRDEPTLISRLVQIAVEAQIVAAVEDILRVSTLDDATLVRLDRELRSLRADGTAKWAFLGERAFFVESCEGIADGRISLASAAGAAGSPAIETSTIAAATGVPRYLARLNQVRGTELLTRLVDAADDHDKMFAAAQRIEVETSNLPKSQIIVKLFIPSLTRAVTLDARLVAQLDGAVAALAAERFRLANDRFPASLAELVPAYLREIPIDPFDGKPLRFKQTDDGIVIYSIDENRVDDGGEVALAPSDKTRRRAPDVGFRLVLADRRGLTLVDPPPSTDD